MRMRKLRPGAQDREPRLQAPAGLLLAHGPRMEHGPLQLLPRASRPAVTCGAARAETGHHALARVLHPRPQPGLQRCLPLELMHPHVARSRRWPPSPPGTPPGGAGGRPCPAATGSSWRTSPPPAAAAPAGLLWDPHAAHQLRLANIQRRDPRDDLFVVLRLWASGLPRPRLGKAAAARGSHRDNWRNLILVLKATLIGPRLAPRTRLKTDLGDHGVVGVSGQQPHPIFRPERASPQGISGLKRGMSSPTWGRR